MAMREFKPSQIYKLLKQYGFVFSHRKSSHVTYKKEGYPKAITIPDNNDKEICRPLARRLLKQAGISL